MNKHKLTEKDIMLFCMSMGINKWLHEKKDDTSGYTFRLDLVCAIKNVLIEALEESDKIIKGQKENEQKF